jgi:hypothetical protein
MLTFAGGLLAKMMVTELCDQVANYFFSEIDFDIRKDVKSIYSNLWKRELTHAGEYGKPSVKGLAACDLPLLLEKENDAPKPWFCHTFSSKALGKIFKSSN